MKQKVARNRIRLGGTRSILLSYRGKSLLSHYTTFPPTGQVPCAETSLLDCTAILCYDKGSGQHTAMGFALHAARLFCLLLSGGEGCSPAVHRKGGMKTSAAVSARRSLTSYEPAALILCCYCTPKICVSREKRLKTRQNQIIRSQIILLSATGSSTCIPSIRSAC